MQLPNRNLEIELTTSSSNYHVEMNPSDVGNQDRYVVQEIIKVAQPPLLLTGSAVARMAPFADTGSMLEKSIDLTFSDSPIALRLLSGDGQEPASGLQGAARLQGAGTERGGSAEQGSTAQLATYHGEVLVCLSLGPVLLQRLQGGSLPALAGNHVID